MEPLISLRKMSALRGIRRTADYAEKDERAEGDIVEPLISLRKMSALRGRFSEISVISVISDSEGPVQRNQRLQRF